MGSRVRVRVEFTVKVNPDKRSYHSLHRLGSGHGASCMPAQTDTYLVHKMEGGLSLSLFVKFKSESMFVHFALVFSGLVLTKAKRLTYPFKP